MWLTLNSNTLMPRKDYVGDDFSKGLTIRWGQRLPTMWQVGISWGSQLIGFKLGCYIISLKVLIVMRWLQLEGNFALSKKGKPEENPFLNSH